MIISQGGINSNKYSVLIVAVVMFRYLELESSGRRDELRLHYYAPQEQRVITQTFPYRLADDQWHQLALTITHRDHVHLILDCSLTYERPIPPLLAQRRTGGTEEEEELEDVTEEEAVHVWVGQRGANMGATQFKVRHSDTFSFAKSHFGPYSSYYRAKCCQILTQDSLGQGLSINKKYFEQV